MSTRPHGSGIGIEIDTSGVWSPGSGERKTREVLLPDVPYLRGKISEPRISYATVHRTPAISKLTVGRISKGKVER